MLEVSFTGFGNCWYVYIPGVIHKISEIDIGDEEITGIFRLSNEDEYEYLLSGNFKHVMEMQPCLSQGSSFLKLVESGEIKKIDIEHCFFKVKQYRFIYDFLNKKHVYVPVNNEFTLIDPDEPSDKLTAKAKSTPSNHEKSKYLRMLNLASEEFWANADRDDKTTWIDNKEVEAWLKEKGFSQRLAESGATTIRPEWAVTGRKPKE